MKTFGKNVFNGLVRSKLINITPYLFPKTLTVLNYHRIDNPFRRRIDTLRINISATPEDFAQQMDYISAYFNVVTCNDLVNWLYGKKELPDRAAMITFDDGYFDNLSNAYPILRERNLPAVIFLTTDFMGTRKPFYWDYIAYCFY